MLRRWRVQEEDIDDLVQETYAKLTKLESVASVRNPKNYMFQTAYSLMISRIRRSQVVSIRAVSDLESVSAFDDTPTPEQSAEDRDELRAVLAALEQLPKACFRVFMLRRVDGLSQKEVASRLGLSENTVEHHMTSAIRFM
jgi:RNA polymerase sigma-70 factor (ECF subfamily)